MEVRPSFSFCIHNIFNGENGIVRARMSACIYLYLMHFLCQVFGAQLLITVLVRNIKNSNTAGIKMPPDVATNNLHAQFPRT